MSHNLPEPLHTQLYIAEVYGEIKKPTTFSCHHNRDVCQHCEDMVVRWVNTFWEANGESKRMADLFDTLTTVIIAR